MKGFCPTRKHTIFAVPAQVGERLFQTCISELGEQSRKSYSKSTPAFFTEEAKGETQENPQEGSAQEKLPGFACLEKPDQGLYCCHCARNLCEAPVSNKTDFGGDDTVNI